MSLEFAITLTLMKQFTTIFLVLPYRFTKALGIIHTSCLVTIFGCYHTGSPSVTTLTFDGQSRTLTCTSTGGPATTVTWRRDGAVITPNTTYQQTKRVVDSVAGAYEAVLTIDSSVGQSNIVGTYNCTVENARGGSSMTRKVTGESWILASHGQKYLETCDLHIDGLRSLSAHFINQLACIN